MFKLKISTAPHPLQVGAFEFAGYETGEADLCFHLDDPNDEAQVARAISMWLEPTTATPGNTATGVIVPSVTEGMSIVVIEAELGPPDFKIRG
jgi:hypothetical protein